MEGSIATGFSPLEALLPRRLRTFSFLRTRLVCPRNVARPMRPQQLRERIARIDMVCLPRIIGPPSLPANPADVGGRSHFGGEFGVVATVRTVCPYPVRTAYRSCPVSLAFVACCVERAPAPGRRPPALQTRLFHRQSLASQTSVERHPVVAPDGSRCGTAVPASEPAQSHADPTPS
jgi:hypothetical protein